MAKPAIIELVATHATRIKTEDVVSRPPVITFAIIDPTTSEVADVAMLPARMNVVSGRDDRRSTWSGTSSTLDADLVDE
jgi:hypothetical protein